jgi:hypothetical protein
MAEQQGASMQVLEHLFRVYMLAVEEYNCAAHTDRQHEMGEKSEKHASV